MAVENFTGYTLVDGGGTISVTATRATAAAFSSRTSTGYVQSDKGASHFTGDFSHLVTLQIDSLLLNGLFTYWQLSQATGDLRSVETGGHYYALYSFAESGSALYLEELGGAIDIATISVSTPYYVTISRTGTTLTCAIYTDASRTTLYDTLSISVTATAYRYVAVATGYNNANLNGSISGFAENLDLQESAAGGGPLRNSHLDGLSSGHSFGNTLAYPHLKNEQLARRHLIEQRDKYRKAA